MDEALQLKDSFTNNLADLKYDLSQIRMKLDRACNEIRNILQVTAEFEEWFDRVEQREKYVYPKQVTSTEFSEIIQQCNVSQNTLLLMYTLHIAKATYINYAFNTFVRILLMKLGITKLSMMVLLNRLKVTSANLRLLTLKSEVILSQKGGYSYEKSWIRNNNIMSM